MKIFCGNSFLLDFFRRIPLEDVPIETDEACSVWLRNVFKQKVSEQSNPA